MSTSSSITVTDIFCGAGGFTTGALAAGMDVRFAANHWPRAIETHNTNYPTVDHFLADISIANPHTFPKTKGLIASPECTNHTLAKGRQRKGLAQPDLFDEAPLVDAAEERSRCTMWDPLKLAEVHDYLFVVMENVVEVTLWSEWDNWVRAWQKLDYVLQLVYLNSMFCHPTPQSRDRLYIVATKRKNRRPDLAIKPRAYCQHCSKDVLSVQSWKNPMKQRGKYGRQGQYLYRCPLCAQVVQPYYYAAANAIDWSIPTTRIGDRKKPLEPKTVARVQLGLRTFRGYDPFLTQVNKTTDRVRSVQDVFPTQTADNGLGLVSPPFTFGMNHTQAQLTAVLEQPQRTQTTYDDTALVVPPPPFLITLRSNGTAHRIEEALQTVCAGGEHHALITTPQPFILDHIHEYRVRSITTPLSTVVAGGEHQSIVLPPSWIMTYYQHGQMEPVEEAVPTVTTLARHALVTASTLSSNGDVEYEDCGFRMLDPREIQAAMAFPDDYIITGNRREQVKQLGNACTPPAIENIMTAVLASFDA